MLPQLNGQDSSKLIHCFSKLNVTDKNLWPVLEDLFLSKEYQMNIKDYVMCSFAFTKNTKNPQIWNAIEVALIKNFSQWKEEQLDKCNIG